LNSFQTWYNHVRTHSNINDLTPAEFFIDREAKGKEKFISNWDGILTGFISPIAPEKYAEAK